MANAWPTSGYCYDGARTLVKAVLILEGGITGTIFCMKKCHLAHVPGTYSVFVQSSDYELERMIFQKIT